MRHGSFLRAYVCLAESLWTFGTSNLYVSLVLKCWTDPLSTRPVKMSLPSQRGGAALRAGVMSTAWREPVLDRPIQDSKTLLFFCFHQAQELCTDAVGSAPPDGSGHLTPACP